MSRISFTVAATLIAIMSASSVLAQHVPSVHGSLDAVTVLPTTNPAAVATQAAQMPAGHMPTAGAAGATAAQAMHEGMASTKTGAVRVNVSQGT